MASVEIVSAGRRLVQCRCGTLLDPFHLVALHLERTLNETQLTTALTVHDTPLELRPGQNDQKTVLIHLCWTVGDTLNSGYCRDGC
jgi:hypothetical protein